MAVRTIYGEGYPDPTKLRRWQHAGLVERGMVRNLNFNIAILNGDSIATIALLGRVPSGAILAPDSLLYSSGITSLSSISVGLKDNVSITLPNLLVNAQSAVSAASQAMLSAVAVANYSKRVWELMGYTSDPGKMVDVYITLNAAAGAAGNLAGNLRYFDIG